MIKLLCRLNSTLFAFPIAQPHTCHLSYSTSQLLAPPRTPGPHPRFYLFHFIFLLRVAGTGWPPSASHTLWEYGRIRGAPGLWGIRPYQHICKETRGLQQTDRCDFWGPSWEREGGLLPCPVADRLRLLQSAAGGRNVDSCLPLCLCVSQKNKPSNLPLLETNFCGAHTRVQHPPGAPSSWFEDLGEQGLSTDPIL